jgi:FkbM family methyltransferase
MNNLVKNLVKPLIPRSLLVSRGRQRVEKLAQQAGLMLVRRDLFFDLQKGRTTLRIRSAHEIYLQHMIENFDYFVDSVIPLQVDGKLLVDMSGPRYHRLKGFSDLPFLFPSHTEPYETTAEYLDFAGLSEGKIVLDIGAYAGITSIVFGQLVGATGHVYAFEADPINYECARENLELASRWMNVNNITLIHKAVWSHSQGVLFSQEGAMGSSAVAITGGGRGDEIIIPSTTLAEFCVESKLDQIDFIKVDIEGGEIQLLDNSTEFLSRTKPRLIIEPHMVDGTLSTQRCREFMERAGYRVNVRAQGGELAPLIEGLPF